MIAARVVMRVLTRHNTVVFFGATVFIALVEVVRSHLTNMVRYRNVLTRFLRGAIVDNFLVLLWQFSRRWPLACIALSFILAL